MFSWSEWELSLYGLSVEGFAGLNLYVGERSRVELIYSPYNQTQVLS